MNNNLNLQKKSILKLILGIHLAVLTPMILQNSNASEQPENIKKIPRDVISTHFFKDLSARTILNFGQSCKKFKEIGDNHRTVTLAKNHFQMLNQAFEQTAKTPIYDPLPETKELKFYVNMFDDEMKKYKDLEKNKIMSMYILSSREQQILLQKLAVRLLFIKLGSTNAAINAIETARVSAACGATPCVKSPLTSNVFDLGYFGIDYIGNRVDASTAVYNASTNSPARNSFIMMSILINSLSNANTVLTLKDISYNASTEILGSEVARITSNFFSTEQCKSLTNNNNDSIKIGRFALQIAQLEAFRIISINAASFIKNLGLKLDEVIRVDTQLPPFDSRKTFLSFLENNQRYTEYMESLKLRTSFYFLDEAMEIISSVFDN